MPVRSTNFVKWSGGSCGPQAVGLRICPRSRVSTTSPALVAASGIDTTVNTTCTTDDEVSAAVQRAVYRTVQEGLTNIHRHAPGAQAWLELQIDESAVHLSLINSSPRRSPDPLPSDQYGLRGLRERAELLGGSIATRQIASGGIRTGSAVAAALLISGEWLDAVPALGLAAADISTPTCARRHRYGGFGSHVNAYAMVWCPRWSW